MDRGRFLKYAQLLRDDFNIISFSFEYKSDKFSYLNGTYWIDMDPYTNKHYYAISDGMYAFVFFSTLLMTLIGYLLPHVGPLLGLLYFIPSLLVCPTIFAKLRYKKFKNFDLFEIKRILTNGHKEIFVMKDDCHDLFNVLTDRLEREYNEHIEKRRINRDRQKQWLIENQKLNEHKAVDVDGLKESARFFQRIDDRETLLRASSENHLLLKPSQEVKEDNKELLRIIE